MVALVQHAAQHPQNTAILAAGRSYTYAELLDASAAFASVLLQGETDLQEKRVAFLVDPGFDYVKVLWAIWRAGGIAVPLCLSHPLPSLQYVMEDTAADIIVAGRSYQAKAEALALPKSLRLVAAEEHISADQVTLPDITTARRAMILYTSGTTNLPKGVVTTFSNLEAQITALVQAWEYGEKDHTICILPLHHVHGILNVISCTLWAGGCVEFLAFSAEGVFDVFLKGKINVFMAVPTIYFKLIAHWETLPPQAQEDISAVMKKLRLMVSGSAALPVSVMEKWEGISGHRLLERYGMTEIGMAISNPYHGERRAGHIGQALPGVSIRLTDDFGKEIDGDQPGEIQVKGGNVFQAYWNKPEATQASFTDDGWFRTGDVAVLEAGYYRILGRNSVDIIKSGGYKISALEIEEVLRTHPLVADCSVVGIPDEEWGELVAAVLVVKSDELDINALNSWLRENLPAYKTPRLYHMLPELPRNAMGKVTKNDLKKYFPER
ncbi:MAG: acyl-CoA synthetase [Saprospiraceae bacterium]|nr:acyl-CoA synthetase [Saprospiraceae bacterium]